MTVNQKRDNFILDDFKACAETASMKKGQAETIYNKVLEVVSHWLEYAEEARVAPEWRDEISRNLRLQKSKPRVVN